MIGTSSEEDERVVRLPFIDAEPVSCLLGRFLQEVSNDSACVGSAADIALALGYDAPALLATDLITNYPEGGDLYVLNQPTTQRFLYLHCSIHPEILGDEEYVLRKVFVPHEASAAILAFFVGEVALEKALPSTWKNLIAGFQSEGRLMVSDDGQKPLCSVDDYPLGGDLFVHLMRTSEPLFVLLRFDLGKGTEELKVSFTEQTSLGAVCATFAKKVGADPDAVVQRIGFTRNGTDILPLNTVFDSSTELFLVNKAPDLPLFLSQLLQEADSLIGERKYAAALIKLQDSLLKYEIQDSKVSIMILSRIATVLRETKRFDEAVKVLTQLLSLDSRNIPVMVALARCLHEQHDYFSAIKVYENALELLKTTKAVSAVYCEIYILLGAAYFMAGSKDKGIAMVQKSVEVDSPARDLGLKWMTEFYLDKGLPDEALRVGMDLLVRHANTNRTEFREHFGLLVKRIPNSVALIKELLASAQTVEAASAWAFLGLAAREVGAFDAALALYHKAVDLDSKNCSFALNLLHTYMYAGRNVDALRFLSEFLKSNRSLAAGKCTSEFLLVALGSPEDWQEFVKFPDKAFLSHYTRALSEVRILSRGEVVVFPSSATSVPPPICVAEQLDCDPSDGCFYDQLQLDFLAIAFTSVKLLFISGLLHLIPSMLPLLAATRTGYNLHKTNIRNEQAYFATICAIMQFWSPLNELNRLGPPSKMLYVCGDSHSLSPSWHVVATGAKKTPTLLVNSLVTGLKCWHLRDEATFYPKESFERIVNSIPNGAAVMFLFGEIDCREGIVTAVERGYHRTVTEALQATIRVYLKKISAISSAKGFIRTFVHFPLPVLKVTRSVVLQFNTILSKELQSFPLLIPLQVPVLDENGDVVQGFDLDSTHISPSYLTRLEHLLSPYEL